MNALAIFALICASPAAPRHAPPPPSVLFDGLYRDVALSGAFTDLKQVADASPRQSPAVVLADWRRQRPSTPDALRRFVLAHFEFERESASAPAPPPGLPLARHIAALWPHLIRTTRNPPPYGSALPLPRPYVVPGGRFRELYYWDSYFTMLGFGDAERSLRDDIIDDFVFELHAYGHIPNGNRTYYLSRSQPPFFFKMVGLTAPGAQAYARFLPELKLEYAYWMRGSERAAPAHPIENVVRMPDGAVLNRYWDERDAPRDESFGVDVAVARDSPRNAQEVYRNIRATAESGWDFSSRWLADRRSLQSVDTVEIVPADLNSILFGLERAISDGCRFAHDRRCAGQYAERAVQRQAAMRKYLWNGKWFDDYRWTDGRHLDNVSAAALYPLFFSLANETEARATAAMATAELVKPGGLVTTTRTTGQQWDAPNGWAPLQWIAVEGLRNYGQSAPARDIACRWLGTVSRVYRATGKLLEKYDVVSRRAGGGGEYPLQDGFGWTNGVTAALLKLYPDCPH